MTAGSIRDWNVFVTEAALLLNEPEEARALTVLDMLSGLLGADGVEPCWLQVLHACEVYCRAIIAGKVPAGEDPAAREHFQAVYMHALHYPYTVPHWQRREGSGA